MSSAVRPKLDEIATFQRDNLIFVGYLGRLENPDLLLRSEGDGLGLRLYDEVSLDAHAASVLQTRYLAVTGREWSVIPASKSARDQEIATFVQDTLLATNFDQMRQELLRGVLYGYYVAEVVWKQAGGKIVPAVIYAKHPRRFAFGLDRSLRLLTRDNLFLGDEMPPRKFIVFTFGSSDNPYGYGLGALLWWPVWFKKNVIKFWTVFLEKYGMPTAVGKYPAQSTPDDRATLLSALSSIQSETAVTIPESMQVEFLEASRAGNGSYEQFCSYFDKQISKAVLGQTATTEGTVGRLGNEHAQEEVRSDIMKADADLLCECLNGSLVRWLVDLNYGPPPDDQYPKMWIHTEEDGDLKPLADRDQILVNMGLPMSKQYFYDTYGITPPEPTADLVTPLAGAAPPSTAASKEEVAAFAEPGRPEEFTAEQLAIEGLADRGVQAATASLAGNEEKLQAAISSASSYEEAMANVLALYPHLDMRGIDDGLSRSLLAASLYGRRTAHA